MLATVTNLSTTDPITLDKPFGVTIPAGGNVTLGLNMQHLLDERVAGEQAWQYLHDLIKRGQITVALVADANTNDLLSNAVAL